MTDRFAELNDAIERHDFLAVKRLVNDGIDLNRRDEYGEPWLFGVVQDFCYYTDDQAKRDLGLRMVAWLIDLGADPNQLDECGDESVNILLSPIFSQDIAMIALLLEKGVDPNRGDTDGTLYDAAWFDYYFEAWMELAGPPMGDAPPDARESVESWLRFVDREAIAKGRPKPDICWLLRRHGALSGDEMKARMGLPKEATIHWRDGAWRECRVANV